MMRLFDAHCHLQDARIIRKTPQLIKEAQENGVVYFAVNGVCEKDWNLVKDMSLNHPSVIPCFGLHPWYMPFSIMLFLSINLFVLVKLIWMNIKDETFCIFLEVCCREESQLVEHP